MHNQRQRHSSPRDGAEVALLALDQRSQVVTHEELEFSLPKLEEPLRVGLARPGVRVPLRYDGDERFTIFGRVALRVVDGEVSQRPESLTRTPPLNERKHDKGYHDGVSQDHENDVERTGGKFCREHHAQGAPKDPPHKQRHLNSRNVQRQHDEKEAKLQASNALTLALTLNLTLPLSLIHI